jgi:hypothetical protein
VGECQPGDLKNPHVFMNEAASSTLTEYYLCCALTLYPEKVTPIEKDNEKLLQLAEEVAKNDVEPFLRNATEFSMKYDEEVHR